jgi:hypothetical protein
MMTEQCRNDLIDRYLAAYNAFDIEGMLATLDHGIRFENFSNGQLGAQASGIEEFRALAVQAKGLFSERAQRIVGLEQRGDDVVAQIAWSGRLAADIPGWPPAGSLIELSGQSEFSFGPGGIVKIVDRS